MFDNKIILITGGTGSFGTTMINRLLATNVSEIRIFSRDEKKQSDMRHIYHDTRLNYYIGDIRDKTNIYEALYGVNYVFHTAALKQVPSCEFFPMEAVKTNIIGTDNLLSACIEQKVQKVICLSTDKAVYPINAMGISKAMMEKLLSARARNTKRTKLCCTRYGNVMCSRGSVIPLFIDLIKSGKPLTVTEPSMTRFMMSLEDAADLTLLAFERGENGDTWIHKAPACTMETLATALKEIFHADNPIEVIGMRPGEKMYETLLTAAELSKAKDMGNFYRIPQDNQSLTAETGVRSCFAQNAATDFTSCNTKLLDTNEMKEKLLKIPYIQNQLHQYRNA